MAGAMTQAATESAMPLSINRLLHSSDSDRTVAFGLRSTHSLSDFGARAAALSRRLDGGGRRYLVHCDDAYAFAVTLAALATSGSVGVLAPNGRPGTLAELSEGTAGAIATSNAGESVLPDSIDPLSLEPADPRARFDLPEPDDERPVVELFTSGSSGSPDRISKTLAHLESEVRVLERTFGETSRAAAVFATVSPQHLYGLLFRVLWPLVSGRPFQCETLLRPEELAGRIAASAVADGAVLIGTPTHLRVMAASAALATIAPRLRAIFSSGGPLAFETASAVERNVGVAPIEIYGSTETGGIAHRLRRGDDVPWTLLDGVEIDIEPDREAANADPRSGRLIVRSPFVSVGDTDANSTTLRFATGDRVVRIADEPVLSFRLDGRVDRVVQVAEKRISLPELEQRILDHPFACEAAAAEIHLQGTSRLGALVVLSEEGRLALAQRGRAALCAELVDSLDPYYDRVVLPRRWRFVHELPHDARGKLAADAVAAALGGALADVNVEPVLLAQSRDAGVIERRYVVPADLAYLEGHFTGFPVVAGVVQLKWAVEATGELLAAGAPTPTPRSVKFRQVLRPLQQFTLRVTLNAQAGHAEFSLTDGETEFSSGRLGVAKA